MWKRKVRHILRSQLDRARVESAQFSMRDLARRLDLSSGALSELLSGKRKLSHNVAKKLVTKMAMSDVERTDILRGMEPRPPITEKLAAKELIELICNWVYFAIFALLDLDDPPRTAEEIASRLRIPVAEAKLCLTKLLDNELIELSADGTFRPVVSISDSVEKMSADILRKAHEKNFRLALSVLNQLEPEAHEFTTLTFAGSIEQIEAARVEIRRLRERLPAVMSSGAIDEIYQLNVQLYPLKDWSKAERPHADHTPSETPDGRSTDADPGQHAKPRGEDSF